jgi:CheY-like chemotaxis protein
MSSKVRFTYHVDTLVPKFIISDETLVWDIMIEFVHNAFKNTFEGFVNLHVYIEDGMVVIKVRDTGVSVSKPEALFHISPNPYGMGLGLFGVYKKAMRLRAVVGYTPCTDEKGGSEFWCKLPLITPTNDEALSDASVDSEDVVLPMSVLKHLRVLVLDTSLLSLNVMESVLAKYEIQVTKVLFGDLSPAVFTEHFDAMIIDYSDGRGLEVIQKLDVAHRQKTFVCLLGTSENGVELDTNYDVDMYKQKPLVRQDIVSILSKCVDHLHLSKVMIIDDQTMIADILSRTCNNLGFACSTHMDGNEGLREIENCPEYFLIIVDLVMPIMNGYEFLQRARALYSSNAKYAMPYFVILTGDSSIDDARGADALFFKPFGSRDLLDIVGTIMKNRLVKYDSDHVLKIV